VTQLKPTAGLSPTPGAPQDAGNHDRHRLLVIEPPRGLSLRLREVWQYRELAWFLLLRAVKPRYRQTVLGIGWAVIPPLTLMIVFSLFFNRVAKIPSAPGVPYPIFSYAGLLVWQYFANATTRGASSLLANAPFLTKVYFPRVLIPLSAVLSAAFDLLIAAVVLVPLFAYYGFWPGWHVVAIVGLAVVATVLALGVSLWLTAASVQYRDLGIAVPMLIQVWMFATPVIYPSTLIPPAWRGLAAVLNPMTAIVGGFRWALIGSAFPPIWQLEASIGVSLALLMAGLAFFNRMERTYADEI
jgi:lipopolysaccharide transport system permease protein